MLPVRTVRLDRVWRATRVALRLKLGVVDMMVDQGKGVMGMQGGVAYLLSVPAIV